ncbi:MAG: DUF3391 domain-containing protein [Pseudomonadales bacterium]|nr:DUF3391 domain-containing protein [Pseudomonadales bacterium]
MDQQVSTDQLCIGMYVYIDLHWSKHPFLRQAFRIKDATEIDTIRGLGLNSIRFSPDKSTAKPLESADEVVSPEPEVVPETAIDEPASASLMKEKNKKIAWQKERRKKAKVCEKAFTESVRCLSRLFGSQVPVAEAAVEAKELVDGVCSSMIQAEDVALQLINMEAQSASRHAHVMNVLVLSMMIGNRIGLTEDEMHILGLGALYHDIGISELPGQVANKTTRLTEPEFEIYKRHPLMGAATAQRQGYLPRDAMRVLAEHHENVDGSGYPRGLMGDEMSRYSKVVSLVNAYDNLTNNLDGDRELTPHEAVSTLFSRDKNRYDPEILNVFVSILGVYPPGTFVTLSDDRVGIVNSVRREQLLFPEVMIYDADIPSDLALIIDLKEEDLSIKASVKPAEISHVVKEYLSMGSTGYYFDS